ncbi:MAG: glutamine synthetase family protein [Prevotellaceae bacterium]|jgi:glutamine synthetase|nr:glutamine synthetase family protein [Prevotellaceae bacterium]
MNINPLITFLGKDASQFTKADIIKFIEANEIRILNFRCVGADGRLKTLTFVIDNKQHLDAILTAGERVDGSSLFPFIEIGSSDLYVIPRYRTAFINPFSEIPALDVLCSYYDKDGNPLAISPEHILRKSQQVLQERTGYTFHAMGELEYYAISDDSGLYKTENQRGYHESSPFVKWSALRTEAMLLVARCGGQLKYGHAEVGNFSLDGKLYEQNELEFLPCNAEDAANQLIVAKWILRSLGNKYGATISFAPKITIGKAGSGMHVHTKLVKNGKNCMNDNGTLTDIAKKAIAGYLYLAPSLTAFGNTNPTSYFRLVPHQEAPTNICWGDRNRSVLVRVPLGWTGKTSMMQDANPNEPVDNTDFSQKQTVEFRCSDNSADIHLLFAGLIAAARHGLEMPDGLEYAQQRYVDVNIFDNANKHRAQTLEQLPVSCADSALRLQQQADIYKQYNVFPQNVIDGVVNKLKSYKDENLRSEISNNENKVVEIVNKYFHCG